MRHRWRPLGNNSRGTALTSDQEALTYHTCMLLSYSITRSLQQPVMEMHHLREKTQSIQDANNWLMAKRRSFQQTVREVKQTNISQVLVSETVPDRRVQPNRRAKMTRFGDNPVTSTVPIPPRRQPRHDTSTRNRREFKLNVTDPDLLIPIKQTRVTTRHSDLREPQLSSSDSQPASSQPVSETTTSESSESLPSSPSGSSSTESTSTSGTDSSSSETSSESSSQLSSNASSPETSSSASTSRSTSPKLLEMECSFNSLLAGTRDRQGHPVTRSQMDNLRDQGVVNYAQQQNVVPVYHNEYLIKNRIIPTKSICIIN